MTAYLLAGVEHGPQMHGPAVLVLGGLAVVGGVVFLVRSRNRSDGHPGGDRSPEASDRSGEH